LTSSSEGYELIRQDAERYEAFLSGLVIPAKRGFLKREAAKFTPAIRNLCGLFVDLLAVFPQEVQNLIVRLTNYWEDPETSDSLADINAAFNKAYPGKDQHPGFWLPLQFLRLPETWETAQDGVVYYVCNDLLEAGVSPDEIQSALQQRLTQK